MSEKFAIFVPNQPTIPFPLQDADYLAVVRDGVTYKLAADYYAVAGAGGVCAVTPEFVGGETYDTPAGVNNVAIIIDGSSITDCTIVAPPTPAEGQLWTVGATGAILAVTVEDADANPLFNGTINLYKGQGFQFVYCEGVWQHQQSDGDAAALDRPQTFLYAQRGTIATVTVATLTFTPDFELGNHFKLQLVDSNSNVIANPDNLAGAIGMEGWLQIQQSSAGNDLISSWGSAWDFAGGTAPTLSTGASAIDVFKFWVRSTTNIVLGPIIANIS